MAICLRGLRCDVILIMYNHIGVSRSSWDRNGGGRGGNICTVRHEKCAS
jgi:hypothetical protein